MSFPSREDYLSALFYAQRHRDPDPPAFASKYVAHLRHGKVRGTAVLSVVDFYAELGRFRRE